MQKTEDAITFFVPGRPQPGGSKRAFVLRRRDGSIVTRGPGGAPVVNVTDMNPKAADWKECVRAEAVKCFDEPLTGPLRLSISFFMPRPKGHFGSGRNAGELKSSAPLYHTSAPDATKLLHSTEDALKHIAWGDDAQVADQRVRKVYGPKVGAEITIQRLSS